MTSCLQHQCARQHKVGLRSLVAEATLPYEYCFVSVFSCLVPFFIHAALPYVHRAYTSWDLGPFCLQVP